MGYRGSLQEPEGGPGDPPDLPSRRKPNRSPYLHRLPRLCPAGHADAPAPRARAGTDRAQRAGKVRSRPDDRRPSADDRRTRDRAHPLHPTRAELQLLINQLKLTLPSQPPPKITAAALAQITPRSE